ncbi:MAG TPA: lytic transglycosylase domain-containing protein [Burkholderiaceae bacterium]|nr:lytic transglycosylase domain-containing protein [Burkholderiaceae bacterium]
MRGVALLVGVGIGAYFLLRSRDVLAQDAYGGIYDARDAWAAGDSAPPVDTTILDAFDAWAVGGSGSVPVLDLWGNDAVDDASTSIENISYDQMGNVINVGFNWGDGVVWSESVIPQQYLQAIRDAEARYRLPRNLLARLLWQESRYRPDIISGATRSAAGALGIAQFMPERISGVPASIALDPFQAIPAAADMLARLYRRFNQWSYALAAYNWGEGNVSSWIRTGRGVNGQLMPTETRNYFNQVMADIGMPVTMA